ncbi:hypothetical protein HZB60_02655 [candidate division KSB1 bacterium]|nr:hypothetical protein [candidate division KSB1 bacterium]
MLKYILLLLTVTTCASADDLDSALHVVGLTRADFRVDPGIMLTRPGQRGKLPIFDQWFSDPLRMPTYERHLRDALLKSDGRLDPQFAVAASLIASGTRRDLIGPTAADRYRQLASIPDALSSALHAIDSTARVPLLDAIPGELQTFVAANLFALADAIHWRDMALRDVDAQAALTLLTTPLEFSDRHPAAREDTLFPRSFARYYAGMEQLEKLDLALLCAAADDLCSMVDATVAALDSVSLPANLSFICRTRHGDTILRGRNAPPGIAADEQPLFALGFPGNSNHHFALHSGISVVIDVSGNDHYTGSAGAGLLGISILADLSGNDTYTSGDFYAQGCGLGGVGILLDRAGDDHYHALGGAQGFANCGVGLLSDLRGNDTYHSFNCAQGCGLFRGGGLLTDFSGNDRYIADDDTILFPSPQSKAHNASMCQGAGYGARRDYIDAHSSAGGVGFLLDAAGDDEYVGGVFCQAVGYWYAIGILDDRAGHDRYRGVWYTQSATAHMGASLLADGGGDDDYTALMTMSGGAAHDFSVSIFIEESGADAYHYKANALGNSLNSSAALAVDFSGDDIIEVESGAGRAHNESTSGIRSAAGTFGVFVDLDGADRYSQSSGTDNAHWEFREPVSTPRPVMRACGWDRQSGHLIWN